MLTCNPLKQKLINKSNYLQSEIKVTRGHQLIQEVLMFMLIKRSFNMFKINISYQVIEKMHQQTYHLVHKLEETKFIRNKFNSIKMAFMFHIPLKLVLEKPVTCKIIFQILHLLKTQI